MPFIFSIDRSAKLIRETWSGPITLAELQESCRVQWAHSEYEPGFSLISDFRDAEASLSADDVLRFASWFSDEGAPRKHAIIVAKQSGVDLAGIFSMLREFVDDKGKLTQLFFSKVAAEIWVSQE